MKPADVWLIVASMMVATLLATALVSLGKIDEDRRTYDLRIEADW